MNTKTHPTPSPEKTAMPEEVQTLLEASHAKKADRQEILTRLVELYNTAETNEIAQGIRHAFLFVLKDQPTLLHQDAFTTFLTEHVEPEDFLELEWEAVEPTASFFESLYSFRLSNHEVADRIQAHLQTLLRHVLQKYEQNDEQEKMFQLMRLAPNHIIMAEPELRRLRHRTYAYELHRVQRHRRGLYIYLVVQAIFVLFIFPFLFINAENSRLQREVEQLTDIKLGDEGYRTITYANAVYWSIITASSIGYGDVTPRTTTGRIIAATLGTMGVVTVGVFAGLVLDWLSPRRID